MNLSHLDELLDRVAEILRSSGDPPQDVMEQTHGALAAALREANGRLNQCERLLHQGSRSEAIQLGEHPPQLLEVAARLDFPERDAWCGYAADFELPDLPVLLTDVAAELNAAYAADQSLEALLDRQRLMALARAPLVDRLRLLRELRRRDAGNPAWKKDVIDFERARHEQLRRLAAIPADRWQARDAERLLDELNAEDWLTPPEPAWIRKAEAIVGDCRRRQAAAELEQIGAQLASAAEARDFARGRKLRQRWAALTALANLADDHPLMSAAAPHLGWVDGESRRRRARSEFEAAVKELEHALDEEEDREELERLFQRALGFDCELPSSLEIRVQQRLQSFELQAARRSRLMLTAVVAAVLLAGGGVAAGIHLRMQASELEATIVSLQTVSPAEAKKQHAELPERLASHPEVQAALAEIDRRLDSDQARLLEMRQLLEQVEVICRSPAVTFEQLEQARALLPKALELATTPAESADIKGRETLIVERRQALQKQIDDAYRGDVAALKERVDELPEGDLLAVQSLLTQARQLERMSRVSADNKRLAGTLVVRLEAFEVQARVESEEFALLGAVTRGVGSWLVYRQALEAYVKKFPERPRSRDLQQALQEADLWPKFDEWNKRVRGWRSVDLTRVNPTQARAFVDQAEAAIKEFGDLPQAHALEAVLPLAAAAAARITPTRKPLERGLADLLQTRLMSKLDVLVSDQGDFYYFDWKSGENPRPVQFTSTPTVSLTYFVDESLRKTESRRFAAREILNASPGDTQRGDAWVSPHARYAKGAVLELDRMQNEKWLETFERLYTILDHESLRGMDPYVRVVIAKRVLETGAAGSWAFKHRYQPHLDLLQRSAPPNMNWLDVKSSVTRANRNKAQQLWQRLKATAPRDALQERGRLLARSAYLANYRPIGWLFRDSKQKWQCRLAEASKMPSGRLFVRYRDPQGKLQSSGVGEIADTGRPAIFPHVDALVQGRPVFLVTIEPTPGAVAADSSAPTVASR